MRYVAACPSCGYRLKRREFFHWQDPLQGACTQCHTPFRSIRKSDYCWALLLGVPSGVLLGLAAAGVVGWLPGIVALTVHFGTSYFLFPYITKLELIPGDDNNKMGDTVD
jgi:hypothetical protein